MILFTSLPAGTVNPIPWSHSIPIFFSPFQLYFLYHLLCCTSWICYSQCFINGVDFSYWCYCKRKGGFIWSLFTPLNLNFVCEKSCEFEIQHPCSRVLCSKILCSKQNKRQTRWIREFGVKTKDIKEISTQWTWRLMPLTGFLICPTTLFIRLSRFCPR
jgi:hypothetical protein